MHSRHLLSVSTLALSLALFSGCATDSPLSSLSGPDATAPGAPTSVIAHSRGNDLVLSWDASVDADVAGYDVYLYAPDPARETSYIKVNSALITDTEYRMSDAPTTSSWYRVKAVDNSTNASAASSALSAALQAVSGNNAPEPAEPGVEQQIRP